MIAWRPTSCKAICKAVCRWLAAIEITESTHSGYKTAHFKACSPPMDPPAAQNNFEMPKCSNSFFWVTTISAIVTTGKLSPNGFPVLGLMEAGPVLPLQLPITFEEITKYLLVSKALSGPIMPSHQPG